MYLSMMSIENFRCFGEGTNRFELCLKPGLTALVGENDAGKTAVVDALRLVLGTSDQEWQRLDEGDFHDGALSTEIKIVCKFEDLSEREKSAFIEYLTYDNTGQTGPFLYVNWTAKNASENTKTR